MLFQRDCSDGVDWLCLVNRYNHILRGSYVSFWRFTSVATAQKYMEVIGPVATWSWWVIVGSFGPRPHWVWADATKTPPDKAVERWKSDN